MSDKRPTERELEEAFINITFRDEREDQNKDALYPHWTQKSRCDHSRPNIHVLIILFSLCTLERAIHFCVRGTGPFIVPVSLNFLDCRTTQLRKLYPGHTVVASQTGVANILGYPAANVQSLRPDLVVSQNIFIPFARRMGAPGTLVEDVAYGCFHATWEVRSMFTGVVILTNSPLEIRLQALYC
jgi:hypothetical protein